MGPAEAECYMGTSNHDKPVCTKLLLDHAGEWHRTAKKTMLKIRSTLTDVDQPGHMKDYLTEIRKSESRIPAIPNMIRDSVHENSLENVSPEPVQWTLPRLDLHGAAFESEDREEIITESLCTYETALETPEENGQNTPYTPGSRKSTRKNFGKPASSFSDFYM